MTDDDQVPDILKPEHDKQPAPASRSARTEAEMLDQREKKLCSYCGEKTNEYAGNPGLWPLYFPDADQYGTGYGSYHHVRCLLRKLDVLSGVSRDSGDAVKLAARLRLLAENEDLSDLDDCEKAADMLEALSASAARLRQEGVEMRAAHDVERRRTVQWQKDAEASAARLTETNKVLDERAVHWHMRAIEVETGARRLRAALEAMHRMGKQAGIAWIAEDAEEALRLSPTANPPEGRTSPVTQDEMDDCYQGGKAPAAGAEENA